MMITTAECCICLESVYPNDKNSVQLKKCGHKFHDNGCIRRWMSSSPYRRSCPVCRMEFSERDILPFVATTDPSSIGRAASGAHRRHWTQIIAADGARAPQPKTPSAPAAPAAVLPGVPTTAAPNNRGGVGNGNNGNNTSGDLERERDAFIALNIAGIEECMRLTDIVGDQARASQTGKNFTKFLSLDRCFLNPIRKFRTWRNDLENSIDPQREEDLKQNIKDRFCTDPTKWEEKQTDIIERDMDHIEKKMGDYDIRMHHTKDVCALFGNAVSAKTRLLEYMERKMADAQRFSDASVVNELRRRVDFVRKDVKELQKKKQKADADHNDVVNKHEKLRRQMMSY